MARRAWAFALRRPGLTIFLLAFAVRAACAVVFSIVGGHVVAVFDDSTYRQLAADMARGQAGRWDAYSTTLYNSTAAFTFPLTVLYSVFGVHELTGPLLSGFFGALAAALVARTLLEVADRRLALFGGAVLALLPSHVLWGSFALKDPAVLAGAAGLTLVCALAWRASDRRLLLWLLMGVVLLLVMAHLRSVSFVASLWAFTLAMVVGERGVRWRIVPALLVVLVLLPMGLGYKPAGADMLTTSQGTVAQRRVANAFGAATSFLPKRELPTRVVEANRKYHAIQRRLTEVQEQIAQLGGQTGTASTSTTVVPPPPELRRALDEAARLSREAERYRNIVAEASAPPPEDDALQANLRHLPKGLEVMLVDPLPWQASDTGKLRAAKAETIVWYPLLVLALVGLVTVGRRLLRISFPLLFGGAMLLVYSLAEGNFGTAYRHRSELGVTVALLAALGLGELLARRRAARSARSVDVDLPADDRELAPSR